MAYDAGKRKTSYSGIYRSDLQRAKCMAEKKIVKRLILLQVPESPETKLLSYHLLKYLHILLYLAPFLLWSVYTWGRVPIPSTTYSLPATQEVYVARF